MSKRPFIVFGLFAALCLLVMPFFALGKEGDEDAGAGRGRRRRTSRRKELFADNCGSCHTLAAAGTDGNFGPDLDELLVPTGPTPRALRGQRYSRVISAVTCGIGGRMPKGILLGEEAQEVAASSPPTRGRSTRARSSTRCDVVPRARHLPDGLSAATYLLALAQIY